MHLLVIRHAAAEDKRLLEDDATRRLTKTGERDFKGVVRGIKRVGWQLDRVFSSPWLRAARTAELLGPLGGGVAIETDLRPSLRSRLPHGSANPSPRPEKCQTTSIPYQAGPTSLVAGTANRRRL